MFQQKNFKTHFFLFITLWLLWALVMQPITFAAGRVENHVITSKVLADAGLPATKELSVYLPEEYDSSGLAYPVLYILHGGGGATNRTFLGAGYNGLMRDARVDTIMDKLIASGSIRPFIVVLPTLPDIDNDNPILRDYIAKDVISFVDGRYRTRPQREGKAISGHSAGGAVSLLFAFSYPDRVSLIGAYEAAFPFPGLDTINAHPQQRYPLRFWLYAGRNSQFGLAPPNRELAKNLQNAGFPVVYEEDDGDHFNRIAQRLEESIVYFSQFLGGGIVAVQPKGKLATTWGEMKHGR
jgi:enterochelin esterase-like enzyme